MRKKQICIALIIVAIILVLSAVLVACNRNQQSDKTDKDPDQPHKHSYVYVEAKEPTCIENGNNAYYTCSCGKYFDLNKREVEYSEYVYIANTLEHKYGEWIPEGTFVCGDLVNAKPADTRTPQIVTLCRCRIFGIRTGIAMFAE